MRFVKRRGSGLRLLGFAQQAVHQAGQGVKAIKRKYVNNVLVEESRVPQEANLLLRMRVRKAYVEGGDQVQHAVLTISEKLLPVLPCLERVATDPYLDDPFVLASEAIVCVNHVTVQYSVKACVEEVVDEGEVVRVEVREK
ncbi:MAG: hypothetical protein QW230_01275 [Thermofilum sp.]